LLGILLRGKNSRPFCFNGRVVDVLELLELAEVIPKVGHLGFTRQTNRPE
jgi:hypothetical protein